MRVLLIDDDTLSRRATRGMLEQSGFEVTEAASGAEGLAAFREAGADVVLCDVFMPDMDGLEVIRRLRLEVPGTCVVAMASAYRGKVDLLRVARLLGAARVLRKPFAQEEVAQAVREA